MRLLVLFFLILPLYSVELISYNIYDRNDRVDLMLSFDNAYVVIRKISNLSAAQVWYLSISSGRQAPEDCVHRAGPPCRHGGIQGRIPQQTSYPYSPHNRVASENIPVCGRGAGN